MISEKNISFRWIYIALPLAILLLSIIVTVYFYHLLPAEVAYHFEGGAPDRWMSRGAIIAWMVVPQFVLVLLALGIISVATILGRRFRQGENTPVRKLLSIMGNMVACPRLFSPLQCLIFSFTMLTKYTLCPCGYLP